MTQHGPNDAEPKFHDAGTFGGFGKQQKLHVNDYSLHT